MKLIARPDSTLKMLAQRSRDRAINLRIPSPHQALWSKKTMNERKAGLEVRTSKASYQEENSSDP